MLFRTDGHDVIAIPQPSHAWLSGQLLRAWGNDAFPAPTPREEVCLGGEQHDIGWLGWEAAPTLNPATGLPHEFRELSVETHTALWTSGVGLALAFGLYPALLVSLHAKTIYTGYFDLEKAPAQDVAIVRQFLAEQNDFQRATVDALQAQPRYEPVATPDLVERNRLLVAAVDRISLNLCWGMRDDVAVPNIPRNGDEPTRLRFRSPRGDPEDLVVDPWPFAADRLDVICEGRRLRGRFKDETVMRQALAAPDARVVVEAQLHPR